MRRFFKISVVVLLTFLSILILSTIVLRHYFPPERLRAIILAEAEEATGRKVSVGDVDISLFHGIDIKDIYIAENRSFGEVPFIRIRRVTVGYSLSEILHRRVVLNKVYIEQPEVFIRSRKGKLALSELVKKTPEEKKKPAKPLPVAVLVQRFEVNGINLFYDAEDVKALIRGINISINGDLYPFKNVNARVSSRDEENIVVSAKGININAGLLTDMNVFLKGVDSFLAQGSVSVKGMKAGISKKSLRPFDVNLGIDLSGDLTAGANVKKLSIRVGKGSMFDLSGSIKDMKGLKGVDVKLTGALDMSDVSRIASEFLPVPVSGSMNIASLRVTGDFPVSLKLETEVLLKGMTFSHKGVTLPIDGRLNVKARSNGDVQLSDLRINCRDAVNVEASASVYNWGKGKVGGKAHVILDNRKSLAMLPNEILRKIGKIDASGTTKVDVIGGRGSENGPLKVSIGVNSELKNISAGLFSINGASVGFSVATDDLLKGKAVATAGVKAKALNIIKGDMSSRIEDLDLNVSISPLDMSKKTASIDAGLEVHNIEIRKGDVVLKEEKARSQVSVSVSLKEGDISVKKIEACIPGLVNAVIEGEIKGWGRNLTLNAKVKDIDYKGLMERVPASIRQKLPKMEVEGNGDVTASIGGSISSLPEGGNPLNITGIFKTRSFGLSLQDKGIIVKKSDCDIDFDISQEVQWFSGRINVGSLQKIGLLDEPVSVLSGFEVMGDGPNVKIKNISATIPEKSVSASLSGEISNYINGPRPNLDLSFSFDSREKTDLIKGINASGTAILSGSVASPKEMELSFKGGLRFDHFVASYQDRAAVKDLTGEIKLSQGVRYAKVLELITEERGSYPSYMASLYDQIRPYVKKEYDLTLTTASFDGYEVGPLNMDIVWNNGNLVIERYGLDLFGGGITGRVSAAYSNGIPEYSLSSNIAGIRFDRILKDSKGGRDVEVNADLNLKGKGTDIEGDINVTKIGKDILDRGLLSLDPNESNPQIVDIRSKLNTLGWAPKEVSIWIRHGELNLDVTLQRRGFTLLNIVGLEKIPVRRIPLGYLVKKGLKTGAN